jgi:hypothetical protein
MASMPKSDPLVPAPISDLFLINLIGIKFIFQLLLIAQNYQIKVERKIQFKNINRKIKKQRKKYFILL